MLRGADGNPYFPPALVPGILEHQRIAPVGPRRDDLDRGFTAQAEGSLQAQRHLGTGGADTLELFHAKLLCFGDVGDVHPIWDAVGGVGASDDVVLAELLRCPAQRRHAVLDGARGELLSEPTRDQLLDVLGLQALGTQTAMAHLVQLIGDRSRMCSRSAWVA